MTLLAFTIFTLSLLISCKANQLENLHTLINSRRSRKSPDFEPWNFASQVFLEPQGGLMEADKIAALPGQPEGVDFDQYAGYVTVDPTAGRALFYYFVESPQNSSAKPLVLWLNGGPGCSSFGYGAMEELGPFRVRSDGKTLYRNKYAWNSVANVIFLESPAGVGFSYSNTSSDYVKAGDNTTAHDSYIFLVNWLNRFPQYKTRDFYITGESYAGHYVPQLAHIIVSRNENQNETRINIKGIAIGNAWVDENIGQKGVYEYLWTHALNSDETHAGIEKNCDFAAGEYTIACTEYMRRGDRERGDLNINNIYAALCHHSGPKFCLSDSVRDFDPCSDNFVNAYLNRLEVQVALHAKPTQWYFCMNFHWDGPMTVLPTIQLLIVSGIDIWMYSGDIDVNVPVTSSRLLINALNLPVETSWRPWYSNGEVGGYVVGYKGMVLATVRGAGHLVPSYQPERALTMIAAFLQGRLPPI